LIKERKLLRVAGMPRGLPDILVGFEHYAIFNQKMSKIGKSPKAENDKKFCPKVVGVSKNGQK
jgi:hypothetical protein